MSRIVRAPGAGIRRGLALAFLISAVPLAGQGRPGEGLLPPMGGGGRPELRRAVEERIEGRLMRDLALNPDDLSRLREAMTEERLERIRITAEERQLRVRIQRFLRGGPLDTLDEAEAVRLLDEVRELRERQAGRIRLEEERLGRILSPPQLLQFLALREELMDRVEAVRGGPAASRPPARRPGPPPPEGSLR